jgi:hypothetical protein
MPIHSSHIYSTCRILALLGFGVFLAMCTPFPNRRDVMERPSVRYLLEMPEADVIPPAAHEVVREIDDGSCFMESSVGAYIISRIGTNSSQSEITAFYRRQFTHFGWIENQNVSGDIFWTRGKFNIELSFIDSNRKDVIGGNIDTSMYQTWYILFIGDYNKVGSNC